MPTAGCPPPVGAASEREMPVKGRSCGEPSLCPSQPAQSPQGVPGPRGRPGAPSRAEEELEGGTGHRAREGRPPRPHREGDSSAFLVPHTKLPLHCLSALPCLVSVSHQRPPHAPSTPQAGETSPGGSWTGAGAAASFIFPPDPVGCSASTVGSPHPHQGLLEGTAPTLGCAAAPGAEDESLAPFRYCVGCAAAPGAGDESLAPLKYCRCTAEGGEGPDPALLDPEVLVYSHPGTFKLESPRS